jgi:D-alanyl-D-alanine dipeptidase
VVALVAVLAFVPDAVLDLRYATARNLTGRPLYKKPVALLAEPAAERLGRAAESLRKDGLRLVVYDAYRPLSAQRALWKARPDPRYVADPAKGSSHNRGAAVDVGLADAKGRPLPMPTEFDAFSPRAAHGAEGVPPEAAANAARLKAAMTGAGFEALAAEWWHYRDPGGSAWPLRDDPLEEAR